MKKIFLFLAVAGTFFTSCSSDDDSNDGTPVTPGATAITLTSNVATVALGGSFTFTVTDNLAANVTTTSQYFVNDVAITSNVYTPSAVGTYSVKAKNGALTSAVVTVTVTAAPVVSPSNSFVLNNTNYETPVVGFGFKGIYPAGEGQYLILWDFNPYKEVVSGDSATYPNDLYLTFALPIVPTGEDEDGEPTFTIVFPTVADFSWNATTLPTLLDAYVISNNVALLPADADERAALIADVSLNITAIQFPTTADATSNLAATYSVTLNDGKVVQGQYSGTTGYYDATGAKAAKMNVAPKNVKLSKGKLHLAKK